MAQTTRTKSHKRLLQADFSIAIDWNNLTLPHEYTMNIYVGNLNFDTLEAALRELFEKHGLVDNVTIITDRETGRSRGFGFVEMPEKAQAEAAIDAINQSDVQGRSVRVNEARPRNDNRGGGRR